jgi:hypothetical protein
VSAEFAGRITAKGSGILFLPKYQHSHRSERQFANKQMKIIHIIVAAFAVAAAITQCGEQNKTKEPTPVEFWF